MKKIAFLTVISLLLALLLPVSAMAASGQETSLDTGDRNVLFSNGYRGFCLDVNLDGAYSGDTFTPAEDTSAATSNKDSSDISQVLKVLFTQCFEDIFVADGSGGYVIQDTNLVQAVVWHFSDGQYIWGTQLALANQVKAYTGAEIPDNGYQLQLSSGEVVTFYFVVMQPENSEQQDFFAYKLEVTPAGSHVHDPGEEWETDEENHWHECECGEKSDEGKHTGGDANCKEPAVCETCGESYGEKEAGDHTGGTEIRNQKEATEEEPGYTGDTYCLGCGELLDEGEEIPKKHTHTPGEEWETDEENHWHECECGDKTDKGEHDGGTADCTEEAECDTCGQPYGEKDPENHTGGTEIRNQKEATEEEPGYTGDTYCLGCGELLDEGEGIPKKHTHTPGEEWETDEENHWHECECGEKSDEGKHTGGDANCKEPAVCETCGESYGEKEAGDHTGGTEIRNQKEATEEEPGYTGDTYCLGCGELLDEGEEIPKKHTHTPGEEWETDEENHWHECECGEKSHEGKHTGGDANCKEPAVCETCGESYGEKEAGDHTGGTEIRNQKEATEEEPGYTGDTYCLGCGELLDEGEEIPKKHTHTPGEEWETDEENHWHECECGKIFDEDEHTGGKPTCKEPAVCETCGESYGEKDPDNHTGGTELRDQREATDTGPGYTGNTFCLGCGKLLAEGEEIPQKHTHNPGQAWVTDGKNHWHECECGEKSDVSEHTDGTADCTEEAECDTCGQPYGEKDPENHTGGTEVRNRKEATEEEPGYTGDTHCSGCGEKLAEGEEIPKLHKHDYAEEWTTDGENHWHECECGEKSDVSEHTGGTADCTEEAECDTCGQPYGEKDPENHTGGTEVRNRKEATEEEPGYTGDTHCSGCGEKLAEGQEIPKLHKHDYAEEWTTDGENHWHECECGEKSDVSEHTGGTADCTEEAECDTCGQPYGEKDPENHTGGTEVRNQKEATEDEPGYTGDTHCSGCGEKLAEGEEIPKLHKHDYAEEWTTDGENHWHECECGDKTDKGEHDSGTADCTEEAECNTCGQPYGEKDPENHTGGTEIRNQKEATEDEPGYTGDTHCSGCGEKLAEGEEIPKLHKHNYAEEWTTDGENHWHECECGDKTEEGEHDSGTADCTEEAECNTCGQPYGEKDPENHTGGTEIRNQKEATEDEPGYTGDTHCTGCGKQLKAGQETPQTHTHSYEEVWLYNEDSHWQECDCGDTTNKSEHTYEDGECSVCKKRTTDDGKGPPKTGDDPFLGLWLLLSVLSAGGLAWITAPGRRRFH